MSFEILTEAEHKARVPHVCIWCGESIVVKDQYIYVCGKYDGDLQTSHYHPECHKAMDDEMRKSGDDCFPPMEFKRGLTEHK